MYKKRGIKTLKYTAYARKAVAAYNRGDFNGALEAIRNCQSVYATSSLYHNAESFLHYKLATQSRDLDSVLKSLNDAAVSARKAWMLCKNSLFLAHYRASMLYLLLAFNQDYDAVIQECGQALAIKNPKVSDRDIFVFEDSRQIMEVDKMMRELRALIDHCKMKKKWVLVDLKKRYRERMKEIEDRMKEAKNRIKSLSHLPDMKCGSVSLQNALNNCDKQRDGKSFWRGKMGSEAKEKMFKVSIEDLMTHLRLLKDHTGMDLVLEAINFAKMWKTWKFWECFHCCKKFAAWESCKTHLASDHKWEIPPFLLSYLPTEVNDSSVEIIVKGEWKPVDSNAAIQLLVGKLLIGSKTDKKVSSVSFTSDLEWPICDDSARTKHLETVRDMLQSLLRYKCLMQYHVDKVIDLTIKELTDIIPERLLVTGNMKTLKLLCFLKSSQFESILQYLQDLSYVFISSESPEMGNSMDEQLIDDQGFEIKEKVILSEDLSFLLLDTSAVTSVNSVQGDDVQHASRENLSLSSFCAGHVVGKESELWKCKRDSQIRQAKELFHLFEEECSLLRSRFKERWEHLMKNLAVNDVNFFCRLINQRKQGGENKVRTYEPWLRELRNELLLKFQYRNYDIENASDVELEFKLDFISHILEIDQIENAYKFEYRSLSDDSLQKKIDCWRTQFSRAVCVDEATMLRRLCVMKQYGRQLEQVSAYDYLSIMLPVLKSFVQVTEERNQPLPPEDEAEATDHPDLDTGFSATADEEKQKEEELPDKIMEHQTQSLGKDQSLEEEEMRKSSEESRIEDNNKKSSIDDPAFEIGTSVSAKESTLQVNVPGTGLKNEALDCFLIMIIQSLWYLREFLGKFLKRSKSHHKHINSPCIVCALREIFEVLHERKVVAPASLRTALIVRYHDKMISQGGQVNNASEFLSVILESLHDSLISDLKLEKKASLDCFVANCYVHRIFGMDHHERINCVKCKIESMHRKYSSFYLGLSADNLRLKKGTHGEKSSDELYKLEMNRRWNCERCGQTNDIYHTLRCLPNIFTIVLSWKKHDESSEDISRTLSALSVDLDLSVLFQECEPDNKYFLVSLVCFSGARGRYICFTFKHKLGKYVQYNDRNMQVIDSWKEVVETCVQGSWQPTILFFLRKSIVDNQNSEITESADELKQLIANDERLLEEKLEHQRQFEHEASLKVNVLGTGLSEATNSFLNMIIKSLWHLREFREKFISSSQSIHKHIGKPCVVCVLFDIFKSIGSADHQGEAVAPTALRIALRRHCYDENIFQKGQMNDASQLLQIILEFLHESFNEVNLDFESEDEYEGTLDCFLADCFVHRIFGMDHYESINCVNCYAESRHYKYTSLSLNVNAYDLGMKKNTHVGSSFDMLLKLVEMNGELACKACGQINQIYHTLWCLPHVFTIVLGWQREDQSPEARSMILSALCNELDLSILFQGFPPDNIYFLVAMLCCSGDGQRNICFLYEHQFDMYVRNDGKNVEVTGSWDDVIFTCVGLQLHPKILFFVQKCSIYFGP